jgi:FkbM family methyltransferase
MKGGAWFYRNFPRFTFTVRRICRANYEREMELLDVLCDRDKTGIDVGAKVGMYTYRIRDRSRDVIAFEPIPLHYNMLKAVFEGKGGRIEPVALSDKSGTAKLRMPFGKGNARQFGRSTIESSNSLQHEQIERVEELEVPTKKLDEYHFAGVGFIKIDVEGHELAVLEGAAETIDTQHPNLLVECNDEHHPSATTRLADWLGAHGYDAVFLANGEFLPIDRYDRDAHWKASNIENFICIHRSRGEVMQRLTNRS